MHETIVKCKVQLLVDKHSMFMQSSKTVINFYCLILRKQAIENVYNSYTIY